MQEDMTDADKVVQAPVEDLEMGIPQAENPGSNVTMETAPEAEDAQMESPVKEEESWKPLELYELKKVDLGQFLPPTDPETMSHHMANMDKEIDPLSAANKALPILERINKTCEGLIEQINTKREPVQMLSRLNQVLDDEHDTILTTLANLSPLMRGEFIKSAFLSLGRIMLKETYISKAEVSHVFIIRVVLAANYGFCPKLPCILPSHAQVHAHVLARDGVAQP